MKLFGKILAISLIFGLQSCKEGGNFREDKVFAGGIIATKKQLNKGQQIYTEYCMACHGVNGDGKGVASKGMKVPPRDFTSGVYKFGQVVSGDLPHDEHFFKILKNGLNGTAMLPWDLSQDQMFAVVSYIKTFAPKTWEGKEKTLGQPIVAEKNPYGPAHWSTAVQKGKEVYHAVAQCQSCHRAYVTHEELSDINKKVNGQAITSFDDNLYEVKPMDSEWGFKVVPPDFTWDSVRSAVTVEELYVRIASGIAGSGMPSWKDTITDEEIWAVAHYVRSLMDLKDSPKRNEFFKDLKK